MDMRRMETHARAPKGGIWCFFSSRRRHTRYIGDWSSDVCSSDLPIKESELAARVRDFLGTFSSGGTAVALEFRGMRPSGEVFDFMKESGAIHSVDLSNRSEERRVGKERRARWARGHRSI